jgi:hypothetical protein
MTGLGDKLWPWNCLWRRDISVFDLYIRICDWRCSPILLLLLLNWNKYRVNYYCYYNIINQSDTMTMVRIYITFCDVTRYGRRTQKYIRYLKQMKSDCTVCSFVACYMLCWFKGGTVSGTDKAYIAVKRLLVLRVHYCLVAVCFSRNTSTCFCKSQFT